MFTIDQIKTAHSKVKTGADFPGYVQVIIKLGVILYETYVSDGHTEYTGKDGYKISSDEKYTNLAIAESSNISQFKIDLKEHQQGKTNYQEFCTSCAKQGVEKWTVNTTTMTCTYYDKSGNEMLKESIPAV